MIDPPENEASAIKEALRLSRSGDLIAAERIFDEILRGSNEPVVHWSFGYTYIDHAEFNKAMVCFRRAIELDEACAPAWGGLGRTLMDLERWDEAEAALRRRLEFGESANHYVFLAMVLLRRSKYEETIACCERALQLDDRQVDALLNQSCAYSALGLHDKALAACRRAISIDSTYGDSHVCLGVVLSQADELEEAADAFQRAIDVDPRNAAAYREFGLLKRFQGDPLLARLYLRAASSLEKQTEL